MKKLLDQLETVTFSFHGTKTLTTGEGGMFVTNDLDLYEKFTHFQIMEDLGIKKQFWPDMIGFKYKMSNIQAAIGCAQIERIDELISKKRDIFNLYKKHLKNYPLNLILNTNFVPMVIGCRQLF